VQFGHHTPGLRACEYTKGETHFVLGSVDGGGSTRYITVLGGGTSMATGYHMLMSCISLSPCLRTFLNTIAAFIVLGQRYRAIKESTFGTKTTVAVASCGRNGSSSRL
jgi:hypothetical protein